MIGYTDTNYSSTLHAPATPSKATSPLPILDQTRITCPDKRNIPVIQLTPLWEHVVRTQSIPKDVDLDDIFQALNERLRNPEWEVRQHALRVLVDVIPVMGDELDQKMEVLLGDLVGNLGHPGPAVRKGALDSLKVYLTHSSHSEDILRNIVYRGVEKYSENQLPSDVVVGIILSLPSLIFPGHTSHNTIEYIVNSLINKLVQVTFQEVSLRSLSRIRDAVGADEFNTILEKAQPNSRRDFELLCQVYDTHNQKTGFNQDSNGIVNENEVSTWNDLNANIIPDNRWHSDSDSVGILSPDEIVKHKADANNKHNNENNVPSGKVILETEIQFNSSTAVTMKILEQGAHKNDDSDSDDDNDDCVVKVFSDSDNEETFELRRRTPRRVRFGGEIVKLRTPDSDSNNPSDFDNDITITTTSNNDTNNPVIEIKFITDERKRSHRSRSLIPIPVYPMGHKPKARSLPTSPNRKVDLNSKSRLLYQSHPNLTRAHFFSNQKQNTRSRANNKLKIQIPKTQQNRKENPTAVSPVMLHREIELIHNLTRSPTQTKPEPFFEEPIKPATLERRLPTADSVLSTAKHSQQVEKRKISTADSESLKNTPPNKVQQTKVETKREQSLSSIEASDNDFSPGRTYSSFILKDSASEGIQSDSYIPNNDSGDCLTCSSSGSEGAQADSSWEASGIVNKTIIESMHEKDDLRTKLRGFEMFANELRKPDILQKFQPFLGPLLHYLFNAERHPRLQAIAEEILKSVLNNSSSETIKQCLPQLSMSLSKMGSPVGIRLGIIVMQIISAKALVQHILEEPIMSSRSAKTREGAMQLMVCATTTFPSTEFDVALTAEKVALVATDRKRRVRQTTLDVLAVLAQLGQPSVVMDAVSKAARDLPDRDGLLAAVRSRLTRRQLPIIEPDGTIITASPGVGHGADIEWVAAGSGSMSPCSARSKRRAMTPATTTQNTNRNEPSSQSQRNLWSARKYPDPSDSFGTTVDNSKNLTWALVPYKQDDSHNKPPPPTQLWAVENPGTNNGDARFNGSGSLRPVYLIQAQKPSSSVRLHQIVPNDSTRPIKSSANDRKTPMNSRGRSSSPPVRLVQINGATRTMRGQSSSPPEYLTRRERESAPSRRAFVADASSDSSQSVRSSPPRSNWRREFQSAIPVPVSGENRARFRRRHRDLDTTREFMGSQPMMALPQHYQQQNGSANFSHHPRITNGRTKSSSPSRINADKFSISQDSGINHQTSSSGSESSDYYTPPAEPYLPPQTDVIPSKPREEILNQSDRSDTPTAHQEHEEQKRERFINLEDHDSTSDFEDQEGEKKNDDSHDETDFVRTKVYQKLHDEHITSMVTREPPFREKIAEKRLSKSHADLSEVKKFTRKTINSAPLVKHLKALENNLVTDRKLSTQNKTLDEESKSSQNSSIENINSASQSQTDLRSLSQSQKDLQSTNQSQIELRSFTSSQGNLSQTSDFRSQGDLRNQSNTDLNSLNQSQKDLKNLSQLDLQSLNDSLTNLNQEEKVENPSIKYPQIVRKKSIPKSKVELKRKSSSIPTKVPTMFPDTLRGYPKPREGFSEVVSNLESPEWEQSVRGLQGLVRLVRHHQDTVEGQLHTICVLLGRHIKNLRSQVARSACLAASEMFNNHKRTLEPELEELVVPLLQRTADTNKFLRADANTALDTMCLNMSAAKSVSVLATRGATHHNAAIRCATARLLSELTHRLGPNRVFQLPREIRDKILIVGANMLMEGSLETRKHTKSMFSVLSAHPNFQRAISEAVPTSTMRHISKILKSL